MKIENGEQERKTRRSSKIEDQEERIRMSEV